MEKISHLLVRKSTFIGSVSPYSIQKSGENPKSKNEIKSQFWQQSDINRERSDTVENSKLLNLNFLIKDYRKQLSETLKHGITSLKIRENSRQTLVDLLNKQIEQFNIKLTHCLHKETLIRELIFDFSLIKFNTEDEIAIRGFIKKYGKFILLKVSIGLVDKQSDPDEFKTP